VSLATSDFARMDSALANFRRGEAPWQERESLGHSPLTPTKSSSIRKPSLPTDLLFLASGLWLREACGLIQNTEDEAGETRKKQVRLPNAGG
jgi:hypothetical protein